MSPARRLAILLAASACLAGPLAALAQTAAWPIKPVKMLIGRG